MEIGSILKNMRDFDDKKGIVSFYYADFNSIDSNGRMFEKNAFNRTIKNNEKRIRHLFNHNPNTIVGKPIEFGKDEKGAFVVSKLTNTNSGQELLELYREDIINEHSFGYQIVNSHMDRDIQVVEEVKMFEVSSVVWGANENTPTISVNSLEMNDLYSKLDNLLKTNELLENKLNELLALVPALQHNDPKEDLLLDLNYITDYIKNYKK